MPRIKIRYVGLPKVSSIDYKNRLLDVTSWLSVLRRADRHLSRILSGPECGKLKASPDGYRMSVYFSRVSPLFGDN